MGRDRDKLKAIAQQKIDEVRNAQVTDLRPWAEDQPPVGRPMSRDEARTEAFRREAELHNWRGKRTLTPEEAALADELKTHYNTVIARIADEDAKINRWRKQPPEYTLRDEYETELLNAQKAMIAAGGADSFADNYDARMASAAQQAVQVMKDRYPDLADLPYITGSAPAWDRFKGGVAEGLRATWPTYQYREPSTWLEAGGNILGRAGPDLVALAVATALAPKTMGGSWGAWGATRLPPLIRDARMLGKVLGWTGNIKILPSLYGAGRGISEGVRDLQRATDPSAFSAFERIINPVVQGASGAVGYGYTPMASHPNRAIRALSQGGANAAGNVADSLALGTSMDLPTKDLAWMSTVNGLAGGVLGGAFGLMSPKPHGQQVHPGYQPGYWPRGGAHAGTPRPGPGQPSPVAPNVPALPAQAGGVSAPVPVTGGPSPQAQQAWALALSLAKDNPQDTQSILDALARVSMLEDAAAAGRPTDKLRPGTALVDANDPDRMVLLEAMLNFRAQQADEQLWKRLGGNYLGRAVEHGQIVPGEVQPIQSHNIRAGRVVLPFDLPSGKTMPVDIPPNFSVLGNLRTPGRALDYNGTPHMVFGLTDDKAKAVIVDLTTGEQKVVDLAPPQVEQLLAKTPEELKREAAVKAKASATPPEMPFARVVDDLPGRAEAAIQRNAAILSAHKAIGRPIGAPAPVASHAPTSPAAPALGQALSTTPGAPVHAKLAAQISPPPASPTAPGTMDPDAMAMLAELMRRARAAQEPPATEPLLPFGEGPYNPTPLPAVDPPSKYTSWVGGRR